MKKEPIKSEVLISSKHLKAKTKLISFSLGVSENNTNQNSFRILNGLKFKTTKNSPDKDKISLLNEEKKIFQKACINQKKTDEFLKQQIIKKKELSTLKRKNFSNPSKKSNEFKKKHHINLITTTLNYKKGIYINSSITSPRQKSSKQKTNINNIKQNKNIKKINKNYNNQIINSKEKNTNNNEQENKSKSKSNNKIKKQIKINNNNKNSLNHEKGKILKNDFKIPTKHKTCQTTPVTNTNSRKTSNEKKITNHNFNQSKKNSILTNLTHNKHNFFHSNNTDDFFTSSSINNLKTNYSNEKYHLNQNKNFLSSSLNFKTYLTIENSPSNQKKLSSKSSEKL